MTTALDNMGLEELTAKPEDAMRLASLATVEGQRIRAYGGEYYRYRMGDAVVVVRTAQNYETGESELCGMDVHAVSDCVWDCEIVDDISPADYSPLEKRLLVTGPSGDAAVVEVVDADVLPLFYPGTPIKLRMVGFPRRIRYFDSAASYLAAQSGQDGAEAAVLDEGGIFSIGYAQQGEAESAAPAMDENLVLLRGVVKDAKVGETYMGMEPMTTFVRVTVATSLGDVELCHTAEQITEEEKDLVRVGSTVSALCVLSGDAAVGELSDGVFFGEEQDLALLRYFFEHGGADRLRSAMHSECAYVSEYDGTRVEGQEAVIAVLKGVEEAMGEGSCYFAYPAHLTGVDASEGQEPPRYHKGKGCLLLSEGGPERYVALCFVETDSLGRIRELHLSCDSRYNFERDQASA